MVAGEYSQLYVDLPRQYDFSETTSREIENKRPTMDVEAILHNRKDRSRSIRTLSSLSLLPWRRGFLARHQR